MQTQEAQLTDVQVGLASIGTERVREAALGAFAGLLGIVFLLLLAADQARALAAGGF